MPGALDKLRRSWKERFRLSSRLGREQHGESSVPKSPQPSAPHSPEAGPPALPTVTAQPMAPATELSFPRPQPTQLVVCCGGRAWLAP
jgi:hypothetical protein